MGHFLTRLVVIAPLVAMGLAIPTPTAARGGGGHSGHSGKQEHRSNYATGAERDSNGRIARSAHARSDFKRANPCPSTGNSYGACPGYVIDHVQPLKRGGADAPYNMQWQTKEEARLKDRTE